MPDLMTVEREVVIAKPTMARTRLAFSTSFRAHLETWAYSQRCPISRALLDGDTHADFGNYISCRNGVLTYTPKGKIAELEEHGREWKRKDRQEGKPARVARSLLLPSVLATISDAQFERFANLVKATDPANVGTIELVQGKDIRKWYHHRNTDPNAFTSCMTYDKCQNWFGIYEENTNVHLLVCLKNDRAVGRALVWDTDQGRVIDRIYASNAARQVMRDYAAEQGWRDAYGSGQAFVVQLEKTFFKAYPYIDTFQYVNHAEKTLTNVGRRGEYDQSLGYADGGPHPNFTCRRCFGHYNPDQLVVNETLGALCKDCATKVACRYCGKVARNMPDQGCDDCVRVRSCECGKVDEHPLTDQGDGRLCAACNALGHDGVARLRHERAEAARLERERQERERRERDEQIRAELEERKRVERLRAATSEEYRRRDAEWALLRAEHRDEIRALIEDGPAILYEEFHYNAESWVRDMFYEHPASDFAPLSMADLRRLVRNVQQVGNRTARNLAVDYWSRIYQARYDAHDFLASEIERIKTCTDRIKVTEIARG